MALNKRERTLLATTVAVLVVGINYLLWQPLVRQWRTVQHDLRTQRHELEGIRATLARAPQWEEEYRALRASLGQRTEKFNTTSDVLKKIEEVGTAAGVIISNRRPLREEDKGVYRELPVQCTVEATVESLVKFLYALQTAAGFMNVEQLQVSGRPDNPNILRCDIQVRALAGKAEVPKS